MGSTIEKLTRILTPLELGAWQYHSTLESTNDLALAWLQQGTPDWSLILADEQTAGRGRNQRPWLTRPGSGLAMSLVFRLNPMEQSHVPRFTALAALSLVKTLDSYGLAADIKWPNDILLCGKKAGGVLVEVDWVGDELLGLVIGMGVNVGVESVPTTRLRYPAISIEEALGEQMDRWGLLANILKEMKALRRMLPDQDFVDLWNTNLAFCGQWIRFKERGETAQRVKLLGVSGEGELRLLQEGGKKKTAIDGEIVMAVSDT